MFRNEQRKNHQKYDKSYLYYVYLPKAVVRTQLTAFKYPYGEKTQMCFTNKKSFNFLVLPLEITSSKSRNCLSMDHKNIDRQFCSSFRTRSEDLIERMSSKTTLKIRLFIKPTATRHVMNEGLKNSEDVGTE